MVDQLSLLEHNLDELYTVKSKYVLNRNYVTDWADYAYRTGYLEAIRDMGDMIKDIRNPATEEIIEEING